MGYANYAYGDVSQRGKEIYEREIKSVVEAAHRGDYLVIDIETGDYEIDPAHLAASHRAHAKHPNGVFFAMRIGYPALAKVGGAWGNVTL